MYGPISQPEEYAMKKILEIILGIYFWGFVIATLYGTFFGEYSYRGFFYNLGRGLTWPTIAFPSFGKFVTGVIIFLFVSYNLVNKK